MPRNSRQTRPFVPGFAGKPARLSLSRCIIWACKHKLQKCPHSKRMQHPRVESQQSQSPVLHSPFGTRNSPLEAVAAKGAAEGYGTGKVSPPWTPPQGTVAMNVIPSTTASKVAPSCRVVGAITSMVSVSTTGVAVAIDIGVFSVGFLKVMMFEYAMFLQSVFNEHFCDAL